MRYPELLDKAQIASLKPNYEGEFLFERIGAGAKDFIECGAPDAYFGDPVSYTHLIEDNDFAVHRMVDTVNCGNTIADPDDFTGLFGFIVPVVIFYFIFYNRYNIVCTNDTHIITSFLSLIHIF